MVTTVQQIKMFSGQQASMDQTWTQWTVKAQAAQAQKLTDQASTTLASTRGNVNERTTKCTIQKLLL